jgi:PleD family two-component response regulator
MTQPLALLLYEKLLPGSQLVNRLQDLGWRVHTIHDEGALCKAAEEQKPILVFADLVSSKSNIVDGIARLRNDNGTKHLPVIAFTAQEEQSVFDTAIKNGATLVVSDTAILQHLEQFIDQALSEF